MAPNINVTNRLDRLLSSALYSCVYMIYLQSIYFSFEISWLALRKFHFVAVRQTCHSADLAGWKNIFWCQKFQENQDLIFYRVFLCLGPSVRVRRVTDGGNASEICPSFVLNYTRARAAPGLLTRGTRGRRRQHPGLVKCPDMRQNKHHSHWNIQPSFSPDVFRH